MTTQQIRSDSGWRVAAPQSSLTSNFGVLQVKSRVGQTSVEAPASAGPCVILPFQATIVEERRSTVDDFAALAAEVEMDEEVQAARKWVAETFYSGELTLAALRLNAGISQAELGARCGLAQSHISRYESGKHEPGIQAASALAKGLGVDIGLFAEAWEGSRRRISGEES